MTTIRANRLTTFSVAADGASVATGLPDESHSARAAVRAPSNADNDRAEDGEPVAPMHPP